MTHSNLTSIDTLADPRTATDQEHVDRRARRVELPAEEYESVAARYEGVDGHVRVGVVDREERAVLARPSDVAAGWRPITGPVEHDEDWIAAATDWVEEFVGVEVDVGPVEHVRRTKFVVEGDPTRSTKAYEVVLHAEPRPSTRLDLESVAVEGAGREHDGEREWEVARFASVPEQVDDGDVADLQPFFD